MHWPRSRWLAIALVGLTLLLAACGSAEAPQQGGAPSGQEGAGAAPDGGSQEQAPGQGEDIVVEGDVVGDAALLEAARKEGKVVLYTSAGAVIEQQIAEEFTARFGIPVEQVREVGGRLHERIMTEAATNQVQADVVHMSDLSLMENLVNEGLIAEHTPPVDDKYPDQFKRSGLYYVSYMPLMYIVYNTQLVAEGDAPKTWQDLLDPKWTGKIGMTHAGVGGTGWSLAYFWRKEFGIEFWEQMAAQKPVIHTAAANVTSAVTKGEVPLGINADTSDYPQIQQGAPLAGVYPPEGVPGASYTFAVMKQAPHPNAARLFANWYLSKEGQTLSATLRGSYSARQDVPAPPGKPAPDEVNVYVPEDTAEFIELRSSWVEEWNEIFGYR